MTLNPATLNINTQAKSLIVNNKRGLNVTFLKGYFARIHFGLKLARRINFNLTVYGFNRDSFLGEKIILMKTVDNAE